MTLPRVEYLKKQGLTIELVYSSCFSNMLDTSIIICIGSYTSVALAVDWL